MILVSRLSRPAVTASNPFCRWEKSAPGAITPDTITDVKEAVNKILSTRQYHQQITLLTDDYALFAGESKSLLTIAVALQDGDSLDQIEKELSRLDLRVDYESAYKESYRLDTREGEIAKSGKAT